MSQKKKGGLLSRYFRLRITKSNLAILLISIIVYLTWLFAFPLFGPILNSYFNGMQALSIEKGKWILLFLASMITSNLITGYVIDKTSKQVLFSLGSAVITSALTLVFITINFNDVYTFSILIGLAAGISPVAWGAYFTDKVSPEERGRVMGIAVGVMMPIAYLFIISDLFEFLSSIENKLLIIGIWLIITFLTLAFRSKEKTEEAKTVKKRKSPKLKKIALYALPMFLFYLVSGILMSMVFPTLLDSVSTEIVYLIWALPFILGAIIGGIQLDLRGRKFPTMVGLAITGVSLAIFGILKINIGYIFIIPLAIGYAFVVVSSYIIWADLAPEKSGGTFYGFGFAIINGAQMIGLIIAGTSFGSVSSSQINLYMFFSAIALFICIPLLILAEESLPRSLIEKRQLLDYLDGVKGKFARKKSD